MTVVECTFLTSKKKVEEINDILSTLSRESFIEGRASVDNHYVWSNKRLVADAVRRIMLVFDMSDNVGDHVESTEDIARREIEANS